MEITGGGSPGEPGGITGDEEDSVQWFQLRAIWQQLLYTVNMAILIKIRIGHKVLRLRRGNYSNRIFLPRIESGPFGCWLASWRWGQLGWELARWT